MTTVSELYEGFQLHVVLDNVNAPKPKQDRWLQRQQLRRPSNRFAQAHNRNAHPFEWTKTVVRQQLDA